MTIIYIILIIAGIISCTISVILQSKYNLLVVNYKSFIIACKVIKHYKDLLYIQSTKDSNLEFYAFNLPKYHLFILYEFNYNTEDYIISIHDVNNNHKCLWSSACDSYHKQIFIDLYKKFWLNNIPK